MSPISPFLVLFIDDKEVLHYNYYDFAWNNMNPYGSYWPFFWIEKVEGETEQYGKF